MGGEAFDYAAIISDLEAKRAALDATIGSLRAAQALGALGLAGEGSPVSNGTIPSMSGGEVPAGAFLGMSIPEAGMLLLKIVKRKQTTKEVAEALKKGGIETKSKSFNAQVHSILDRARKAGTGIVKLDGGYWGLAEWYPSALRTGTVKAVKKGSKSKKAKKNTKQASQPQPKVKTPITPATVELKSGSGKTAQMVALLKGHELSAEEIAVPLGIKIQVANLLLGKLVKGKIAEKTAGGKYRAIAA